MEEVEEYQDAELREFVEMIFQFVASEKVILAFDGKDAPNPGSSAKRQKLHALAERLELYHESMGKGEERSLILSKNRPQKVENRDVYDMVEYYYCDTYYGLKGPYVDWVAERAAANLDESVTARRKSRDGPHHHITVISTKTIADLPPELTPELLFDKLTSVPDDWQSVGIGTVQNEEGLHAIFLVLSWPSASLFLAQHNLPPQNFHITLGFQRDDIHNVVKDESTLVSDMALLKSLVAIPPPSKQTKKNAAKPSAAGQSKKAERKVKTEESNSENIFSSSSSPSSSSEAAAPSSSSDASSQSATTKRRKAPLSPFIIFCNERRGEIKAQNPDLSFGDLVRRISEDWVKLSPEERRPWEDKAKELALQPE